MRFQRYVAAAPEVGAGISHIIAGDGPTAQFRDFVVDEDAPAEFPYSRFHRSVERTFQKGWAEMEATVGEAQLKEWRGLYHELGEKDETVRATSVFIDETVFARGVELGPEITWYAVMVALAAWKRDIVDPDAVRDIAMANTGLLFARSRKNITHTFSYENYYNHVDCDAASLTGRNKLVSPYTFYREGDVNAPVPAGMTVGCVADLVEIERGDEFSALENSIFACINKMHEQGLFDPRLAYETWELCKDLNERLEWETAEMARRGHTRHEIERYSFGEFCKIL